MTLLALWAFTDQTLVQRNENLFQVSPLSLLLAVVAWASFEERGMLAAWLATATAGLALLGLLLEPLPGFDQHNAAVLALTLPAHLGLAWGVWQWRRPRTRGPGRARRRRIAYRERSDHPPTETSWTSSRPSPAPTTVRH